MRILIIISLVLIGFLSHSQCTVENVPFTDGEQLDYTVYYQLKKMWVPAGRARFEVTDSSYNGQDAFHFNGRGKSYKEYDWFFKVRDQYQSYAHKKTLRPFRFQRDVHEGKYSAYYDYLYNDKKKIAVYKRSKTKKEYDKKLSITPCTFDVLTAVYYARTIDFSKYKVNDTIPISMVIDGEVFRSYLRYTGKGTTTTQDGKKYKVIRFKPLLIEGTIFKGGEDMEVSVTDDKNRIPIYIEAKILVGTIKVYLMKMKGLKYPLTSLVK